MLGMGLGLAALLLVKFSLTASIAALVVAEVTESRRETLSARTVLIQSAAVRTCAARLVRPVWSRRRT